MEVLVGLGLIGAVLWFFLWYRPRQARRNDAAQVWVEQRTLALLSQDMHASDEVIATLVRDDIINARARDPLLFAWATSETVARLRRTAFRVALEQQQTNDLPESTVTHKCAACGAKNKASRLRCRKCKELLPAGRARWGARSSTR